jgi:sugar phosphate isomerase/epimerase
MVCTYRQAIWLSLEISVDKGQVIRHLKKKRIFNELRRLGYDGFVGMEHFTKTSYQSAFEQVKRLAGVA